MAKLMTGIIIWLAKVIQKPATSCEDGGKRLCSKNGFCVNLEEGGFFCKCTEGYFGNGRNCVKEGHNMRVKGKISGTLNGRSIENLDFDAFVVTKDGRAHSAVSRLDPDQGFSMTPLSSLGGVLGWMFGVPVTPDAKNGYMITGGDFNRSATVKFEGYKVLHIKQWVVAKDTSWDVTMITHIDGEIPELPQGSVVRISDYKEDYIREAPAPKDPCDEKPCDSNAECESEGQQYNCTCNDGYEGNGRACRDINECELDNDCHQYANCYNTPGSYTCRCQAGYRGDGQNCERELTCDDCDWYANCVYDNETRETTCVCNTGHKGDGLTCDPEDTGSWRLLTSPGHSSGDIGRSDIISGFKAWTGWYNIDSPYGSGDYEQRSHHRPVPCGGDSPIGIEHRIVSTRNCRGMWWSQPDCSSPTRQVITAMADYGLMCLNSRQFRGCRCCDYAVRYRCL